MLVDISSQISSNPPMIHDDTFPPDTAKESFLTQRDDAPLRNVRHEHIHVKIDTVPQEIVHLLGVHVDHRGVRVNLGDFSQDLPLISRPNDTVRSGISFAWM